MHRSTYCVSPSKIGIASRSGTGTTWIACSGKCPVVARPAAIIVCAMSWLEFSASLPPRKIVALPDLKHRLAASAVTFGRLS